MAKYCCKNCGAELYFDPKIGKLHCEYCDAVYDPSEFEYVPQDDPSQASEQDKTYDQGLSEDEIEAAKAAGMSDAQAQAAAGEAESTDDSAGDLVVYKCPHCGAEVITSKETAATTCVYCNRAITLEGNLAGVFKPDYVLPFVKTEKDAEEAYWKLCRASILTPKLFMNKNNIKKIKGMYVPFWLYSFDADAKIKVKGIKTHIWQTGNTEYTEVSEYAIYEDIYGHFDRIPVDAMKGLDNDLMDSVEPFDVKGLKPFNPAYLAGFYTQRWDDSVDDNESRAKSPAHDAVIAYALNKAGNYGTKTISGENIQWRNGKAESAMMPIWMMYTEYKGKNYVFGMNGQTGKLMGEIPKSKERIFSIMGGVFLISQIILMIVRILGVM